MEWADLNAARVKALAPDNDPRPGFAIVWPNILWIAEQFWQAQADGDDARRLETWHHLVMAVGNFKRQGGTQIRLLQAVAKGHDLPGPRIRPSRCTVQSLSGLIELERDRAGSWKTLTADKNAIQGIQVATATTLLSALWPGEHIIIDFRELNSTIALNLAEALTLGWVTLDGTDSPSVTWDRYEWVRSKVFGKAAELGASGVEVEPLQIERALYTLDQAVTRPPRGAPKLTWQEYTDGLGDVLSRSG